MRWSLVLFTAAATAANAANAAAAAPLGEVVVTPEQFGAVGDGQTNDWAPISAALAVCSFAAAPCRIVFGGSYLSGPLVINSSATTLEIDGELAMLDRASYCAASPASCEGTLAGAFISTAPGADGCRVAAPAGAPAGGYLVCHSDVALRGEGAIVATAPEAWWVPCKRLGSCWRPHLLVLDAVCSR